MSLLGIDVGTSGCKAAAFSEDGYTLASAYHEYLPQHPQPGWAELDSREMWDCVQNTIAEVSARVTHDPVQALAVSSLGEAMAPVSEDRQILGSSITSLDTRGREYVEALARQIPQEAFFSINPNFFGPQYSLPKLLWLREHQPALYAQAHKFLLWVDLVGFMLGCDAVTSYSNAARTLLLDIRSGTWDDDLLRLFRVPRSVLPEVRDTAAEFGTVAAEYLGAAVSIRAVAGDQQAALIGQACLQPGMVKATYGTGGFVLLNTGPAPVRSTHRLLTTIAYQWRGSRHFALEGSIFAAGATVQWLRDALGILASSFEAGELAAAADQEQAVYLVPAFAGLGAPYWSSTVRGTITGLTRGTTRKELARAALESVGYQTRDLLTAMYADVGDAWGREIKPVIRVDGGMSASDWTMQFLSDVLDAPVDRPTVRETTALGVALAAGWQAGLYAGPESFSDAWRLDRSFRPGMPEAERQRRCRGWRDAVARALLEPGE